MEQWCKLYNDNASGSVEILNKTIALLCEELNKNRPSELNELRVKLNNIQTKHPHFLALRHFIKSFNNELEKLYIKKDNIAEQLISFIENYKLKWDSVAEDIGKEILEKLDLDNKKILLHSNSMTVTEVMRYLKDKVRNLGIFQTASAPVNEGRIQAEKLAGVGYKVNYITEASVGKFMDQIDYVFLGADAIFPDKFLNKTGSLQMALTAKYYHKDVFVISDSRKYLSDEEMSEDLLKIFSHEKEKPKIELWNNPPENVIILNYYFEFVPKHLIKSFFLGRSDNKLNNSW